MYGFSSYYWDVDELAERDQRAVAALNTAFLAPEGDVADLPRIIVNIAG